MKHRPWPHAAKLIETMSGNLPEVRLRRHERSPGLHCSTLLAALTPHPDPLPEAKLRIFGMLGFAFEDRAEMALTVLNDDPAWPYIAERVGEVEENGVACSPDVLLVPKAKWEKTLQPRELSLKVTWKSCKGLLVDAEGEDEFGPKFDYYINQCQAYAKPLETSGSILFVYFLCGTWRPPQPQIHAWELDFSAQEIGETWDALETIRRGIEEPKPRGSKIARSVMEQRRKR